MTEKTFNPQEKSFKSKKDYEKYREDCRCGVCHKKLDIGDKFQLRPIQDPSETGNLTVQAVIVHSKCINGEKECQKSI